MTTQKRRLSPPEATQMQGAAAALQAGQVQRAEKHLAALSTSCAWHPEFLRLMAILYDMRGMRREAMVTMDRALTLCPNDALYHNTMATVLGNAGELDGAIAALRRACELQPGLAMAWYNLGIMLARHVRYDEAAVALRHAVELDPSNAAARTRLADMLRDHGNIEAAEREYRHILLDQPWSGSAWWGLADLKTIPMTQVDIERMREALKNPQAGSDDRVAISFALAKALDDNGHYDSSLTELERAKAVSRQRRAWDATSFSNGISALNDAFTPAPTGSQASELGREVIFIVGIPRSGSTLTEQILASHPQVEGAGELHDLKSVLIEESQRRDTAYPGWVHAMQPTDWERLGRRYLQRTEMWRRQRPVFTDKLPNNWMFISAILAMMPSARIVCCRRDPLETCFSCYRQYRSRHDYTDTFADLASYWRDYDRSVRLWQAQYPSQVYEHYYEGLLDDPDTSIRQLLGFCGLPDDSRCMRFYENRRDVHTPSATQVREPLRKDTARSRRYGALLDPLRTALRLPLFAGQVGENQGRPKPI